MYKLKRGRGFEASKQTVTVSIDGSDYEAANLLKSGITHQNIILLGVGDLWHEVNVLDLGADDSNLDNFKHFVEIHNLKLEDLGIVSPKYGMTDVRYGLNHDDFMRIEALYPDYSYIKIAKLHKYFESFGRKSYYEDLRDFIGQLAKNHETVESLIDRLEKQKQNIINHNNPMKTETQTAENPRIKQLTDLELTAMDGGHYEGFGITVPKILIDSMPDAGWDSFVATITKARDEQTPEAKPETHLPEKTAGQAFETAESEAKENQDATDTRIADLQGAGYKYDKESGHFLKVGFPVVTMETIEGASEEHWIDILHRKTAIETAAETAAPKKPVSLETIGNLTPNRITELQTLKTEQESIVKANPFVAITDKATLDKAKKSESALLKASTAIDGKTGIKANKNKFLKQFSDVLDKFLDPLAKMTRDAHEKQKAERLRFETAEELRIQNEQKAALAKIKERTDRLFAVPMIFNGTMYAIGTCYIMPSQIEAASDEDFDLLVKQAEGVKIQQDAEAQTAAATNDALMTAAKQLSQFNGKSAEQNYAELTRQPYTLPAPEAIETVEQAAEAIDAVIPAEAPGDNKVERFMSPETATAPQAQTATTPQPKPANSAKWEAATVYVMAEPGNKVLNGFDLEHVTIISKDPIPAAFIKCRSFYVRGLIDAADELERIIAAGGKRTEVAAYIEQLRTSK